MKMVIHINGWYGYGGLVDVDCDIILELTGNNSL